jgi:signal transduction histidine kinase
VLYNLIDNAIKFTEKGSITFKAIERKDHWEFQVKDTGIGIDKKDYEVVFREFGRIENDKIKEVSGSGLGLALSKRIIKLHGGDIWFESKLGKGTVFYFTIPKVPILN